MTRRLRLQKLETRVAEGIKSLYRSSEEHKKKTLEDELKAIGDSATIKLF